MSEFLWFLVGNVSGAIVMTALWIIIGTKVSKSEENKAGKGDEQV